MQRLSKNQHKYMLARMWLVFLLFVPLWLAVTDHRYRLPANLDDICQIFEGQRSWYRAAKDSEQRWGTPTPIQMAIMEQESSFRFNARPQRQKLLGFIPWTRQSDAYGYAQALDSTWLRYKIDTGRQSADRDDFNDAIDFIGWYTNVSNNSAGISRLDPYNQYLAYHEGQAGWSRGSYQHKDWLMTVAKRVDGRARDWSAQLQSCEQELDGRWWRFMG